ncbi:MAG: 50S ribosomal protein L6 [Kiritimatiellae bacterium]|nr:50S ribosomal protein L6 [Kiritimatiellia bacterium]
MSRVGQKPIPIPAGVTVAVEGATVSMKGPGGALSWKVPGCCTARVENGEVCLGRADDLKATRAQHGTSRSILAGMIRGVSEGFSKMLTVHGVGFRAAVQGQKVVLTVGYSSPVEFTVPDGITVEVQDNTRIQVKGANKQQVGQVAARLRGFCPPEPYKGKGIRYDNEHVRRKAGKSVA